MTKDLKNYNLSELEKLVTDLQGQKFLAKVLFTWIQQKNCGDLNEITSLSKEFRQKLIDGGYTISNLVTLKKNEGPDGTIKYVFGLADKNVIETVLLNDQGRKTLCISSQVGCKFDCKFCATGKMGFTRDLTAGEIVDQVIQAEKDQGKISNLVYMGMGEPLDNYDEVIKSIYMLNCPAGKNIGARNISISTSGIIPGIKKLSDEKLQIRLAISLHAPTDTVRNKIMKINHKYPLTELIPALKKYQGKTGRRITFEYILLEGINDDRAHARGLLNLLSGIKAYINLIEFNDFPCAGYKAPSHKVIKDFQWIIQDRGFECAIRFKRGREIQAACGQLGGGKDY